MFLHFWNIFYSVFLLHMQIDKPSNNTLPICVAVLDIKMAIFRLEDNYCTFEPNKAILV